MKTNDAGLIVGTKYETKCGNVVEIADSVSIENADGELECQSHARMVHAVPGHESLMGVVQKYRCDGKWLNSEGLTVDNCIHDISKEYVEC